jgi:hypothetical protein
MEKTLPKSYGVKFDFEIKSDTRDFDRVDAAAIKAGIKYDHMPQRPSQRQAISRAIAYLMRVCMTSIEFPSWSPFAHWEESIPQYRVVKGAQVLVGYSPKTCSGRNPNYSLKITEVKQARVDASTTWRINIANRNKQAENLGHVLSVTYDNGGLSFTMGTDMSAWETFGKEVMAIVNAEYKRFAMNYNDEDIRNVLNAELADMRALKIIKATNCFIAHEHVERAKALYKFAEECGQVVSWLGLDNDEMTRDSLLRDLKATVFADLEEYEGTMDKLLNTPPKERKRGEAQRERMFNTAISNIDKIFAQAEYYAQVLGVMSEELVQRRNHLRTKATEFLTKDFDKVEAPKPVPVAVVATDNIVKVEEAFPSIE